MTNGNGATPAIETGRAIIPATFGEADKALENRTAAYFGVNSRYQLKRVNATYLQLIDNNESRLAATYVRRTVFAAPEISPDYRDLLTLRPAVRGGGK
jgi:hypothetical protein